VGPRDEVDFGLTVQDQVDALQAAAETLGFLDLSRVGIRGWSFGGELAAMAVLRRPDVFHAAVIGAPVTDQRLYDTFYTERYLGHPDEHPEAYEELAAARGCSLQRPVLLIHGSPTTTFRGEHAAVLDGPVRGRAPHELVLILNATHPRARRR
jgi:dipeptidyl-peptidase-4